MLSLYALLSIFFTGDSLSDPHYFNLIATSIILISFVVGNKIGHLLTFLGLMACFFSKSTFLVSLYHFEFVGLTFSWIYLPLIILFVIINYEIIGYWVEKAAKNESE